MKNVKTSITSLYKNKSHFRLFSNDRMKFYCRGCTCVVKVSVSITPKDESASSARYLIYNSVIYSLTFVCRRLLSPSVIISICYYLHQLLSLSVIISICYYLHQLLSLSVITSISYYLYQLLPPSVIISIIYFNCTGNENGYNRK